MTATDTGALDAADGEQAHSPLPWQEKIPLFNGTISVYDDNGIVIAQFFADREDGGPINAAANVQITRNAVNSSPALEDALTAIVEADDNEDIEALTAAIRVARTMWDREAVADE